MRRPFILKSCLHVLLVLVRKKKHEFVIPGIFYEKQNIPKRRLVFRVFHYFM